MKQQLKYDPEDIESLMLAKSFDELLPEERTFVLRHIESEQEYDSMRHLLLQSISALQTNPPEPPSALREKVMGQFRTQYREKPQHRFWLNLYSTIWIPVRQRPYIAVAVASVLVFFGVFLWIDPLQDNQLALEQPVERPGRVEQHREAPATNSEQQEAKTYGEVDDSAPAPVAESKQTQKTTSTDVERLSNQAEVEVAQSEQMAEEVEVLSQPKDESTTSGAAAIESANTMMTDSEMSEAEDTARSANGQVADKQLVNDALFAMLYTAR